MADIVKQQGADINAIVPTHICIAGNMVNNEKRGSWGDFKNVIRKHTPDKGDLPDYAKKYLHGPPSKRRKTASNAEQPPPTGAASSNATRAELANPDPVNSMIQTFLAEQAQNQMAFMSHMRCFVQQSQQQAQLALANGGAGDALERTTMLAAAQLADNPNDDVLDKAVQHIVQQDDGTLKAEAEEKMMQEFDEDELKERAASHKLDEFDEDELKELAASKALADGTFDEDEIKELVASKALEDKTFDEDEIKKLTASEALDGDLFNEDEIRELAVEKIVAEMPFEVLKKAYKAAKAARKGK